MALTNLKSELDASGARVHYGLLPSVKADHSLLALVFQTLIGKALKFRRATEPPHIQVEGLKSREEWIVSVPDNGRGFDPQHAQQVFLPFKRLHGTETPGSGIGLAKCKRIIDRLGGRIWAEASPGQGATFYFTLPEN